MTRLGWLCFSLGITALMTLGGISIALRLIEMWENGNRIFAIITVCIVVMMIGPLVPIVVHGVRK